MNEATFKPAVLARAKTYRLQGGVLSEIGIDGPKWELPLADVEYAAYVDAVFRKIRMTRLDLHQGDTCRSIRLGQPAAGWIGDPDTQKFLTLARDICAGLEAAQPGTKITQGEYGRARWIMFIMGVITLVFSIGILALVIITGVPSQKLWAGMVPMGLMFLFGGYISYLSFPWRALGKISAAELVRRFDHWLTSPQPPLKETDRLRD